MVKIPIKTSASGSMIQISTEIEQFLLVRHLTLPKNFTEFADEFLSYQQNMLNLL